MIRHLQKSLLVVGLLMSSSVCVSAQLNLDVDAETRTPKQIIDSYGGFDHAVLQMTRDEWTVVREWPEFEENRYLQVLRDYKASFAGKREKLKDQRLAKVLDSDCECWVEPDDTYTTLVPPPGLGGLGPNEEQWASQGGAGWDVDCSSAPIALPGWTFELYGSVYSEFYVNSKGMISFGGDVIDWTPTGFPAAEYNQIAGYWQDTDNRSVGEIKYKVTPEAVYVNYVDVGYYNNHDDLTNNYQIIITPNDGIIGDGNNAQVCYLDMNWAHGDVGGGGGCCGSDPGVTGADQATTGANDPHVQFGRFNLLDDTYNGPYGTGPLADDGINWLDYKYFNINTALSSNNLAPVPTENIGCDTITICLGQTHDIGVNFLGPEPGQSVTLDVTPILVGANVINDFTVTDGENANISGTFVGNEPGVNVIEISAVDDGSPASTTQVSMYIEVLDVTVPELTVSGNMSICAGAATEITADGAFDSFSWNINSDFYDNNVATIPFGGNFVVTGYLDVGCQVSETFFIDQSPYYLPDIVFDPETPTICSDDSVYVEVVPAPDENFVDYTWEGNWQGLGGTVYDETTSGNGAWVSAGMFRVEVEDDAGCFGQRVFQINSVDSDIPDITVPNMCNGLDTIAFTDGYFSTSEGDFNIYLITSNNAGWEGTFVNVIVNGEAVSTLTLNNSTFGTFSVPIAFGDLIEIEYISDNPANDAFNSMQVFNCSNSQNTTIIDNLSDGIVFSQPAMCEVVEAMGTWQVTSGPQTSWFENTDQYNTLWAPSEYGAYELCFYEEFCSLPYCYEFEVTLPPTIELGDNVAVICEGESLELVADTTDPGLTATINWPYPGTDNILENDYSYTQYTEAIIEVEIENGCGYDVDTVEVTAHFDPNIDSAFLCSDDDEITLDPLEGDQNLGFVYEWTFNGDPIDGTDELTVNETGSYCVIVTNECYPDGEIDCGFIDIVSDISDIFANEAGGVIADCDGDGIEAGGITTIELALPGEDYIATWPDGSQGHEWTIPEDVQATDADGNLLWDENGDPVWEYNGGQVCVDIEDPYGCGVTEHCVYLYIGAAPFSEPSINGYDQTFYADEPLQLCPEIPYDFDLNSTEPGPPYGDYTWWTECGGQFVFFQEQESIELVSWMFPQDCWGYVITLTGSSETPCGMTSMVQEIIIDECEIEIPNVFTPRNADNMNQKFEIIGLDNYENVLLRIYDRWGNLVYEDYDYRNSDAWYGDDAADGTYWYTLVLPNGREYQGTVNIFR